MDLLVVAWGGGGGISLYKSNTEIKKEKTVTTAIVQNFTKEVGMLG